MSLMFMGDVHGERGAMKPFLESDCKTLIQLGDFGFVWKYNDIKYNKFIRKFSKEYKDKEILFVSGNHENYDVIDKCPMVKIYRGRARKISPNIFALIRGEIYTIDGKTFLSIGGADSQDKLWRMPGVSWWEQERISARESVEIFNKIANLPIDMTIDYVVTHTMPLSIAKKHFYVRENSEKTVEVFLDRVFDILKGRAKKWYCGHWHDSFEEEIDGTRIKVFNIKEFRME